MGGLPVFALCENSAHPGRASICHYPDVEFTLILLCSIRRNIPNDWFENRHFARNCFDFIKTFLMEQVHLKGRWLLQIVCSGPENALTFGIKWAKYSTRPRNQRTSLWSFSMAQFLTFAILSELVCTPYMSTLQPRMSKTGANGSNFCGLYKATPLLDTGIPTSISHYVSGQYLFL